jgi:hypothetical protein
MPQSPKTMTMMYQKKKIRVSLLANPDLEIKRCTLDYFLASAALAAGAA